MSDWKETSLKENILKANTGADAITRAPIVDYDSGVRCLRIQNVSNSHDFRDWGFCEISKENYPRFSLQKGDILIARTGNTIGVNIYIESDLVAVFNNGLIRLRFDIKKVVPKYIYYVFKTSFFEGHIKSIAYGTSTQPNMQIESLLSFTFDCPPLQMQENIIQTLSCLDAKIENLRRQNETLEQIAQALFKHWFIDFEFLNADGKPYKSSGGGMFASELGDIPEGWKVGNFGDIVVNFDRQRIPLSSNERQKRQGIYPYYGATSIMDYVDDYLFDGLYILMGEDGTVIDDQGYPVLQYVFGKFWVNNHAHVLQGKNEYSSNFIYLFLKQTKINNIVTGAVQPKINQANMNGIKLVIPKIEQVKLFDLIINPIFEKKMNNIFQIQTLTKTRDSVLPKLMSGQLRVKE